MPKKLTLPAPPVVPTQPTTGNLQDWAQKLVAWALDTRGKIETWSVNSGYLGIVTAEETYAALAGNSSQTFSVADASTSHEAVSYEQVHNIVGIGATDVVASGTSATATTASFTAPCKGYALIVGQLVTGTTASITGATISASLGAVTGLSGQALAPTAFGWSVIAMTAGQSSTFSYAVTTSANATLGVSIMAIFIPTP